MLAAATVPAARTTQRYRFTPTRACSSFAFRISSASGPWSSAPGDLEQRGQALEGGMAEEDAEPLAELALEDVRVPVAVRPERRLRVVQVQAAQPVEADVAVELLDERVERVPVGHVVAGDPQVARVEADAEPRVPVSRS